MAIGLYEQIDTLTKKVNKLCCAIEQGAGGAGWGLLGNSGTVPGTNFIGTTDNQALMFKVNNAVSGFITSIADSPAQGGSVYLGQYAGQNLGTSNSYSVIIGHAAGKSLPVSAKTYQSVIIGNWAGYYTSGSVDAFGLRSVLIGQSAAYRNVKGSNNTIVGTFGLELNNYGINNTGLGRDVLRSNIDGAANTSAGLMSLLNNTTGIKTITVTNPGSGYTTAAVTISYPGIVSAAPGTYRETATATATIAGGQITGITVTNPGGGYSLNESIWHPPITVTITGDGVGAEASVTAVQSGDSNTAYGAASGFNNKRGVGGLYLGYFAVSSGADDNYPISIGYSAKSGGEKGISIGYSSGSSLTNAPGTVILGGYTGSGHATATNNLILADGVGNIKMEFNSTGQAKLKTVPSEYADNAAALVAGLTAGDVYRTGDNLKIVH